MATRRMIITVKNEGIDELWNRKSDHLDQGKWMSGSPPKEVKQNSSAEIRSEKESVVMHGTKGWIEFESIMKRGSKLTIAWDKPYGHDDTTCSVEMKGIIYAARVENKNFEKDVASCDVVISMNTDPNALDTRSWMGRLPQQTTLNSIMMPGSHDAGMSELKHCFIGANAGNTQTQELNMQGQLEAGSRYFDIRVDYDHKALVTYHRTGVLGCNGQNFDAVMDQTVAFLQQFTTETVILKISHIRDKSVDTSEKIKDMLNSPKYSPYLYKCGKENLAHTKLGDVAGKIIVVLEFQSLYEPHRGFLRYVDGFDKENVCAFRGTEITVCDLYSDTSSYDTMSQDQIAKWDKYGGFGKEYLFLLSWTLTAGAFGSIRDLALEAHAHLPAVLQSQITDKKKGKPNIVYIDYVNVEIAKTIIRYNF